MFAEPSAQLSLKKRCCPLASSPKKRPRLSVAVMTDGIRPMLSLSVRRSKPKRLSLSMPISPDDISPFTPGPPQTPHIYLRPTIPKAEPHIYEHYIDGPKEIIPGVWLGDQHSPRMWEIWAKNAKRVRIINVAQEIEDPFGPGSVDKVKLASYEIQGRTVDYCHLRWSHSEQDLADIKGELRDVFQGDVDVREGWQLWEALRWLEIGRRRAEPVLIHCQLGISRSATLAVAYIMTLAAAGLAPQHLYHISTMTDAYNYVKERAPAIGPNNSLVFLLVEFGRNLTTLLSRHPTFVETSWPASLNSQMSEAEWAKRREEFELSPIVADEATRLDVEMARRAKEL